MEPLSPAVARRLRRGLFIQAAVVVLILLTAVFRQTLSGFAQDLQDRTLATMDETDRLGPQRIPAESDDPDAIRDRDAEGEVYYKYAPYDRAAMYAKIREGDVYFRWFKVAANAHLVSNLIAAFTFIPLLASVYIATPLSVGDPASRTRLRLLGLVSILGALGYVASTVPPIEETVAWFWPLFAVPYMLIVILTVAFTLGWVHASANLSTPVDLGGCAAGLAQATALACGFLYLRSAMPAPWMRHVGGALISGGEILCVMPYLVVVRRLRCELRSAREATS